jgi:IclR family pca regulon transcriptional regulator
MSINLAIGSRLPAHATSMGKVLLAHLPAEKLDRHFRKPALERLTARTIVDEGALRLVLAEVRRQGWAIADEETEHGVRSAAAPVFDRVGSVQAAVNVAGHSSRVTLEKLRTDYVPVVLEAARGISQALGATVPDPTTGLD